jgi:exodeoxyribonuclease VII large subunit
MKHKRQRAETRCSTAPTRVETSDAFSNVLALSFGTVRTQPLSVTEYSARLGRALRDVGGALIEGEVQKFHMTPRGMMFFDLTDGESLLSCKVFPREAARLDHRPAQGDLVQACVDRPDLYSERGSLHLIVSTLSLAGEGELLRRRQELIARLTTEGLCDRSRRRPLPRFPRAVGVIAGQSSDGMSDVIQALTDRWPSVDIVTCASVVQGRTAPRQLVDALARLQDHPLVDVIVMARGGGSVQDLVGFDDEGLCRALFACEVPVVCAIGHTDNNPVCNHVAWPAYAPSRSAELVVPSAAEVRREIAGARDRLNGIPGRIQLVGERLGASSKRLDCAQALDARAGRLRERAKEVQSALDDFVATHSAGLARACSTLTAVPYRASRVLAHQSEQLPVLATALAGTEQKLMRVARDVTELGDRVRTGTRRQLVDHTRDYGRAVARLGREARSGLERRDSRARELIVREGQLLYERVRRRLDDAQRDAAHLAALVAARDFRRRGWLLAASDDGNPVRSAADLRSGQRIDLHLHDGRAAAIVDTVNPEAGSST